MGGEDETVDLHSHCCRCHTLSVRRTSCSHACGGEEEVRALSQAKRKRARRKGQKERANAFQSRLLAQTLLTSVFKAILVCSQTGYYP